MLESHPVKNDATRPAKPARSRASKKPTKSRRQTVAASRASLGAIRRAEKASSAGRALTYVRNPTAPFPAPSTTPFPAPAPSTSASTITLPAWESAAYPLKTLRYFQAIGEHGPALAFTLNLSPKYQRAARDKPETFKDNLVTRIKRNLESLFLDRPPIFAFVIGTTGKAKGDRVHVHGAIAARPDQIEDVKAALTRAGGKWAKAKGEQYQTDMEVIYDAGGWASYCERHIASGWRVLGSDPIFAPNTIRTNAKRLNSRQRLG